MDGAPAHKDKGVSEFLQQQGVQTVVLAPYGYNIAPIELFFAHFKQGNLNQARQAVGKR